LSQVANTFWDDRIERIGAEVKASPIVKRRDRARRLVDAIILTIILAAAATCVSVYTRARAELDAAMAKHQAAGAKLEDLTIKVEQLDRDVKQLRTDPRVIELFARQRFGFVRAGDVVIKVAQESEGATSVRDARAQTDARGVNNAQGVSEVGSVRVANLTPRTGEVYTDASN
jgi:cell division protein FtsB